MAKLRFKPKQVHPQSWQQCCKYNTCLFSPNMIIESLLHTRPCFQCWGCSSEQKLSECLALTELTELGHNYGLNLKCPSQACMLKAWSPADGVTLGEGGNLGPTKEVSHWGHDFESYTWSLSLPLFSLISGCHEVRTSTPPQALAAVMLCHTTGPRQWRQPAMDWHLWNHEPK
jgi:hypothetical protein